MEAFSLLKQYLLSVKTKKPAGRGGKKVVFLRGLPGETKTSYTDTDQFKMYNHLPAKKFNEMIQKAKLVIARAGYSTVMDLAAIAQKAVLVPTPGQSEQEYLAKQLQEQNLFMAADQDNFILEDELRKVSQFPFAEPVKTNDNLLDAVVKDFLERLRLS